MRRLLIAVLLAAGGARAEGAPPDRISFHGGGQLALALNKTGFGFALGLSAQLEMPRVLVTAEASAGGAGQTLLAEFSAQCGFRLSPLFYLGPALGYTAQQDGEFYGTTGFSLGGELGAHVGSERSGWGRTDFFVRALVPLAEPNKDRSVDPRFLMMIGVRLLI